MSEFKNNLNFNLQKFFVTISALPAAYLLFMMFWGGLRYPFWDHVSNYEYIIAAHDDRMILSSFFRPHNEHLIFIPRIIHTAFAQLTSWNVGAEFALLFLTYLGSFALVSAMLLRVSSPQQKIGFAVALFVMSIFFFSPAQHNNFWWSFMLQLALTAFFSYAAFFVIGWSRNAWISTTLAVGLCWCAVLCMANGVIAMLAGFICVAIQTTGKARTRTVLATSTFWGINFILAAWLQMSVREQAAQAAKAGLWDALKFLAIYVGNPLRSLLSFPYINMFAIPRNNDLALALGFLVLLASGFACLFLTNRVRHGDRPAVSALACLLFGLGSGAVIAIGRAAIDQMGIANAAASRYVIYSTFIYVGLGLSIGCIVPARVGMASNRRYIPAALSLLMIPAFLSYANATAIFEESARFNQVLAWAYSPSNSEEAAFDKVYPQHDQVVAIRKELLARRLGPYDGIPSRTVAFGSHARGELAAVPAGETDLLLNYRDHLNTNGTVCALTFQVATHGKKLRNVRIAWATIEGTDVSKEHILRLPQIVDWQTINLPVVPSAGTAHIRLRIISDHEVRLPLRRTDSPSKQGRDIGAQVQIAGKPEYSVFYSLPVGLSVCS